MMRLISCAISAWKAKVSASSSSMLASCCTAGSAIAERGHEQKTTVENRKCAHKQPGEFFNTVAKLLELSRGRRYTHVRMSVVGRAC